MSFLFLLGRRTMTNQDERMNSLILSAKRKLFWDCIFTPKLEVVTTPPTEWLKISSWSDDAYCTHLQQYIDGTFPGNYDAWKTHRDKMLAKKDLELSPGKFTPNPASKDHPKVAVAPIAHTEPDNKRYLFNKWADRAGDLSVQAHNTLRRQVLHNQQMLVEEESSW